MFIALVSLGVAAPDAARKPIVIAPGATYRDTMPIWGVIASPGGYSDFRSADVEGTYRLTWSKLVLHYDDGCDGFGDPVPPIVSNTFRLRDGRANSPSEER